MAEVRIPFCAAAELQSPFILDETFTEPNGVKSVLFDKSKLKIVGQMETVEVPDVGPLQLCIYHLVGTIPYMCNAFPVIPSDPEYNVQEQSAIFDENIGNLAASCVVTTTATPLGWVSAAGCVTVDVSVGGSCSLDNLPAVEEVSVDDLAVANNITNALAPTCVDSCGEEVKHIVKWRGCFVVKTSE
jgi:hypothetical protein